MKDLKAYAQICIDELHAIGIYPNHIDDWKVNTRAKSRWGLCSRKYHNYSVSYSIQIASCLLADNAPVQGLKETILHELIHAVDGCMNHGENWKAVCDKVNKTYGYNIKRSNSYEDKGFEENPLELEKHYRYRVTCNKCHTFYDYQRNTKIVQACRNGKAKCSCGGLTFTVIEL